ncbi:MAG: CBS domain-containing protein [Methanobrevibacter sp.]|jgi:IMP dehydrogenase|nr:CBS domain-containing protein [Methanobrevibacter sp.]
MGEKVLVKDYMARNVITVKPETPIDDIIKLMRETGHDGYPVINENNEITGFITAFDFVRCGWKDVAKEVMSNNIIVTQEDMSITDTSRVMFRHGLSRLPVIDRNGKLTGIISNTDMIRSHIERTTPNKVESFRKTLEQLYSIRPTLKRMKVRIDDLRPTQDKIYADELQGRKHELERGLAEPVIVAKTGERWILIDGHHRVVAAIKLNHNGVGAYVIDLNKNVKLGLERTADKSGIYTFDDLKIIDDDQHQLISIIENMKRGKQKDEIDKY